MGAVRTGTVTFLFTDIEGSTRRWQSDESAMSTALRRHDEALAATIESNGGRVFKHTGDGIAAVFGSARQAVTAAVEARARLSLPVRMGLHTGEAEERDGDYFGPALNLCARIMDAGHGGQILASSATRQLVVGLDGIDTVDLGRHSLKGIVGSQALFQVGDGEFPPLRTTSHVVQLPNVGSSLVGRDQLVDDVLARLDDHRVVTLTGVGGAGKTRVAIAAAARAADDHDLTVFVDLAEATDDDEVLPTMCRALGVADHRIEALSVALSERTALIVLDNCEHVLGGAADLVEDVLGSASLKVLATSREGLAVPGELLVAVPGLDADDDHSVAVELFVERATALDHTIRLGDADRAVIAEICRRLDGLPLAIELAAARLGLLAPAELLARLDDRFQLLTGGRRRRTRDRQRTLRETIDWSYELLDDDERVVFEALSVFGGSFGLDGAVDVVGDRSEFEVLDILGALIDKSLLTTVDVEGQRRYRYLETIRSYAEERLAAGGDAEAVMGRLQHHMQRLVPRIVELVFDDLGVGAARLRVEIANLRRCFDDALDRDDAVAATGLIAPFGPVMALVDWRVNGWAAEALALSSVQGSVHEAPLLAVHGLDRWLQGRFGELRELADRMLTTGAAHTDVGTAAAFLYWMIGDDEAATRHLIAAADRLEPVDPARSLFVRLRLPMIHAEPARRGAVPTWTEQDATWVAAGLEHRSSIVRGNAHQVAAMHAKNSGDFETMRRHAAESADLGVPGAAMWFAALQLLGLAEHLLGHPERALRTTGDNLREAYRVGDLSAMILPLCIDALVLESLGEVETAAIVRGRLPRRLSVMMISDLDGLDRRLAERLEPDQLHDLLARGSVMEPRDLQALTIEAAGRHLGVSG